MLTFVPLGERLRNLSTYADDACDMVSQEVHEAMVVTTEDCKRVEQAIADTFDGLNPRQNEGVGWAALRALGFEVPEQC